jgi:hypothetical protein
MISRREIIYNGEEIESEIFRDVNWDEIRSKRGKELSRTDWRFMSDQTPSQEWIDYRVFLRDLPQNYDTANDAADAWNEYEMPE